MQKREDPNPNEPNLNRSEFLSRSAKVAGGLAVASAAPSLLTAHAAPASAQPVVLRLRELVQPDGPTIDHWPGRGYKAYPNITIKLEYVDYNGTAVKTTAEALAGNVPDLIMCSTDHTPALVSSGLLMDLNPLNRQEPDVNPMTSMPVLGRLPHGRPLVGLSSSDNSSFGIYYNKNLFDQAEIAYPPPASRPTAWTLAEFVRGRAGAQEGQREGVGSYWANPAWDHYTLTNFMYMAGGRNFASATGPCIVNSPQTAQGIQFAVDLIHKYKVAPSPQNIGSPTNSIDYFASGLAAMRLDGQWDVLTYEKSAKFPWDLGYFPLGMKKKLVTGGSGCSQSVHRPSTLRGGLAVAVDVHRDRGACHDNRCHGAKRPSTQERGWLLRDGGKGQGYQARTSSRAGQLHPERYPLTFALRVLQLLGIQVDLRTGKGDIPAALAKIQQQTNAAIKQKAKNLNIKL